MLCGPELHAACAKRPDHVAAATWAVPQRAPGAYAKACARGSGPSRHVLSMTRGEASAENESTSYPASAKKAGEGMSLLMHTRRELLRAVLVSGLGVFAGNAISSESMAGEFVKMEGLQGKDYGKQAMTYSDFVRTDSGLQYKDVRVGTGKQPEEGDRAVLKWEGYTIGYLGRIFEAKGKAQGGAFDSADKDYFRFVLGSGTAIPALDEAVRSMREGGVRQVIVPPELGYPASDPRHEKVGPRPSTFSGQRALDFVLENRGLIDKTLLINIQLVRVDSLASK
ncbi:Peptidyl-prolyl cis-trans isomerase FKBP19, chloroplastic [Porphyridium purpureum]|uniref:peptidylprolyl isomerase n=1 Tax=Porphyridium purpureum TaxID=35688 RepID=A0A5J4Z9W9_PORPP|nr:Peptidyl-prolyl cis-trans isomerase FKBP19, chloroplastic [Porphyridium purpureum]|eukprot:POR7348..scf295_1